MDLLWMYMLVGIATGVMVGVGATLYLHQGMRKRLAVLEKVEAEYKAYRKDVTRHFVGTAGLVNQLTQSYKAVYDHLEEGAYQLVDEEELRSELGNDPSLAGFLSAPQLEAEHIKSDDVGPNNTEADKQEVTAITSEPDSESKISEPDTPEPERNEAA